jgi:hypothetical protein
MKTKTIHCYIDNDLIGSFNIQSTKKVLQKEWYKVQLFFDMLNKSKNQYLYVTEFPKDSLMRCMAIYAYVSSAKSKPSAKEIAVRFAKDTKGTNNVITEWAAIN